MLAPATRTRRASSRLVAIALLLSLVLFIGGGCTLSEKEELDVGRKTHAQIEKQFGGKVEDPAMQQYVNSVGMEMARRADRPNMAWQFAVLKSDQINAFAVPGGYVYITRGLLAKMQNEAQLAGVLGHEAAHIAKRHSAKQVGNQRVTQGLSIGAGIVGGLFGVGYAGDVASLAFGVANLSYGRNQEKEADLTGLQYMTAAGYDPHGMVQTMQILQSASGKKGGGAEWLSTHPNPGNRVEYLTAEINKNYPDAKGTLAADNFARGLAGQAFAPAPNALPQPSISAPALQPGESPR